MKTISKTALLGSLVIMGAAQASPFMATSMTQGYQNKTVKCDTKKDKNCVSAKKQTKKAEAKCGEAKCGASAAPAATTTKKAEAKCGEAKCGAAPATTKKAEAKCGEAKCGGQK